MSAMRVHIFAIVGALIGAFILIIATLSVNGTTLQSFQTTRSPGESAG